MTKEQTEAITILNLLDELSTRNSYEDYRQAVLEIKNQAVEKLGAQS